MRKQRSGAHWLGKMQDTSYLTVGAGEAGEDVRVDEVELCLNLVAAQVVD